MNLTVLSIALGVATGALFIEVLFQRRRARRQEAVIKNQREHITYLTIQTDTLRASNRRLNERLERAQQAGQTNKTAGLVSDPRRWPISGTATQAAPSQDTSSYMQAPLMPLFGGFGEPNMAPQPEPNKFESGGGGDFGGAGATSSWSAGDSSSSSSGTSDSPSTGGGSD